MIECASTGIEAGNRLVGQDHLGFLDHRPGDTDSLLLPTTQRIGAMVVSVGETDPRQLCLRPGVVIFGRIG